MKYGTITNISLVTDTITISIYRKADNLKCRYDIDIGDISTIFSIY